MHLCILPLTLSLFYCIDDDYNSGTFTVKLEARVTSTFINIPVVNDVVLETNEEFELTILSSSLPNTLISGSPNIALMTIIDDDRKLSLVMATFIHHSRWYQNCALKQDY